MSETSRGKEVHPLSINTFGSAKRNFTTVHDIVPTKPVDVFDLSVALRILPFPPLFLLFRLPHTGILNPAIESLTTQPLPSIPSL